MERRPMTESQQQLHEDLRFVRHAVETRDSPQTTPAPILLIWSAYVLIGYTLLDFNRAAAGWFFMIGGIAGGLASTYIGRRDAVREGHVDRAEGRRRALHWSSILIAVIAILALVICRQDQLRGSGEIVGQIIVIVVGVVYFLAGVHFDRLFIWLGLLLIVGSIAISFMPYGRETQYCVRAARSRNAAVIAITDGQLSPVAQHADIVLPVIEGTAFAFRSLTSTISLCQTLFIALAARLELDLSQTHDHDSDEPDD
jgi:hypothetical protein